jgi:hypothetical protein
MGFDVWVFGFWAVAARRAAAAGFGLWVFGFGRRRLEEQRRQICWLDGLWFGAAATKEQQWRV